jgi:hypothetical protein
LNPLAIQVMVDIETMGTNVDAPILSIGLVRFTVADGVLPYGHGHWHIDLADSLRNGAQADGDTISWWLTQPEASRRALCGLQRRKDGHGGMLEADALWIFHRTLSIAEYGAFDGLWANGIDFDLVILSRAFTRHKLPVPWAYWQQRDLRTLRKLLPHVPAPERDEADKHNALRDAMHQAAHCAALLRALRAGCAPREEEAQA